MRKLIEADAAQPGASHASDRPIIKRSEDELGRSAFAEAVARAIRARVGKDSFVIAIYGPWGSGKSSVANMIVDALADTTLEHSSPNPLVVRFNPWQCTDAGQITAAFFREIGVMLKHQDKSKLAQERAKTWKRYSRYFTVGSTALKVAGTALTVLGVPAFAYLLTEAADKANQIGDATKTAAEALAEEPEKSLFDVKHELGEELKEMKQSILVVIDDVDRLSVQEIVLLLQLVKANGDFPNMVYLLLFQRDIVEKSLESVDSGSGAEFLEKIVQQGLDIPAADPDKLQRILFCEARRVLGKEVDGRFVGGDANQLFHAELRPYFQTLRDVRRFINTPDFHVGLFRQNDALEVNPVDLVACPLTI